MKKLIFIFIFLPALLHASTATLFVDVKRENVNALEATVHIPRAANISSVYTGNSNILIWIKTPLLNKESESISFSGVTPGGFTGMAPILQITGEFSSSDLAHFTYSDIMAVRNDGSGAAVPAAFYLASTSDIKDVYPPEPFTIQWANDDALFNGNSYLSFAAQDKDTGISKYEEASAWIFGPNNWHEVNSPYEVKGLEKFKRIYIRANDFALNSRVVSTTSFERKALIIATIILLCALLLRSRRLSLR